MNNEYGAELYRRYLDGDDGAFEEIITQYRKGLIFFINRFVNNVDTAEDIAADVFAYLIFKPKKYNFTVSLKTYLYMIGRSRALDYIRKETRRRSLPYEALYKEPSNDMAELEEAVIKGEENIRLYKALDSLSEDYKTAVILVYFEGMKNEEAAAVMKKNKKQIENLLYRAKKALKITLEKEEEA